MLICYYGFQASHGFLLLSQQSLKEIQVLPFPKSKAEKRNILLWAKLILDRIMGPDGGAWLNE